MKTIGLLGGTGWASTIGYYQTLNEMVHKRLGGFHSAQIILKSIDYSDIKRNYGKDDKKVSELLKEELEKLAALKPDCLIICNNTLHKYYDVVEEEVTLKIPLFHAVRLTADHINKQGFKKVLLLATKNTMEEGFFERTLTQKGISVTIPNLEERDQIHYIHSELVENRVTEEAKNFFESLIKKYDDGEAVVLGCTELPMVVTKETSALPIIDPIHLQCTAAVEYSLRG